MPKITVRSAKEFNMSEEEAKELKIENLIHRLNNLGMQRKHKMDELWVLEERTEKLRQELVKLIDGGLKDI